MKILKNTWHHQLYTFPDRNTYNLNSNVCRYIRGVLAGLLLAIFVTVIASIISLLVLDPILSTIAYLITDIAFISFFGVFLGEPLLLYVGFTLYGVAGFIGSVITLFQLAKYTIKKTAPVYKDTKFSNFNDIVAAKVKSNHDKICRNIEFKNEK